MGKITINGLCIETTGGCGNISIQNGIIKVDGKLCDIGNAIDVNIIGDVQNLSCDGSATISGNVKGKVDAHGSVQCGDIGGSVNAGGSIHANNIQGNMNAGGSIRVNR